MILVVSATKAEIARASADGCEILVTGIGPVEAAAHVARALARSAYELVVSAGVAGAYDRDLEIGSGVVVAQETLELNAENGDALSLPAERSLVQHATSDVDCVNRLVARGFRSVRGVTSARVTATDATAQRMLSLGAQIESMEGFAVLRAAALAGVPAVEVRGISNYACERSRSQWDFAAGVRGLAAVLRAVLER
ncbi:MAG: hypothetical protein ACREMP_06830 [Candidatus Tyrphobacter sp.]